MELGFGKAITAAKRRPQWISYLVGAVLLLVTAYYVGTLIANPQRRVIEAAAGLLLFYLASRLSINQSLAFFLIVYPYPTFTSAGSTNTLMLLVIGIVWAIRVTSGELKVRFEGLLTPILPVILLGYLISTYSIQTDDEFINGMAVISDLLAGIGLYFMMGNFIRDEKTLRRTLYFLGMSSILIHIVAVYEVLFPGHAFLEGWIIAARRGFQEAKFGVRTGGPFRDFELLSEYCAVTTPIVAFLWLRAPKGGKLFWTVVLGLTVFSQFATVTRGGFLSLSLGLVYLFWMLRKEVGIVRSFGTLLIAGACMVGIGLLLPHLFRMESLFERLGHTTLVNGMPDSRVGTWTQSWERMKEHPFLGHGPYFTSGSGLVKYSWPHCGYLFLWVTVGLTGLLGYVAAWLTCLFATGRHKGAFLSGPFTPGLLTALHVSWLIFIVDQIKIDFARNPIYFTFTWMLMGLTGAAYGVARDAERALQPVRKVPAPARPAPLTPLPAGPRIRKIMDP